MLLLSLPMEPRGVRRGRSGIGWLIALLLTMIAMGTAAGWIYYTAWQERQPNMEHITPHFGDNPKPIFYKETMLENAAAGTGDSLMLPLAAVKEYLDPHVYFEEESDSLIITTADKVARFKTDQLTAWVNEEPVKLVFPVQKDEDGSILVPIEVMKPYYHFTTMESPETGAVLLFKEGDVLQWASIVAAPLEDGQPGTAALRSEPSIKSPIYADLPDGEEVIVWADEGEWYRVQTKDGWIGYTAKSEARLEQPEVIQYEPRAVADVPWKPLGGKINLTWEHVVSRNPDTAKIGPLPGLNVISPTWFYLADDEGKVGNKASISYMNWAHKQGYQVWALFSNDFDPDRTRAVLSNYDTRMNVIRQLIHFAETYKLQGINIDFENVYQEDKDRVTQFVREMTPFLHEQGLVVSIDVTIRGGSPMWSLFLDREALGKTVDYMMVMTYDEHWASSPIAGSVASLPWTEKGIADIIQYDHVPPSKLLLGVPYYTRIWSETTENGKTKVSSKAVGMAAVNKLIADKKLKPVFDEKTGQDYVEYMENGELKKIWIENEKSMRARMEIVRKYDLAGVASWRRGFETADIWPAIQDVLERRP